MPFIHVAAALLCRGDRVLAARRPPQKPRGGLWEFPGGKIEPGETAESCLERELREELGISVKVGAMLAEVRHEYPDLRIRLTAFRCECTDGEPSALEHQEIRWLLPEELGDLQWSEADREIVAAFLEGRRYSGKRR